MRLRHLPSPNHAARPPGAVVDTLVLHYTGMVDAESALTRLRSPTARVSAHYVVLEDGEVLALVDEHATAWHAGVSCWRGRHGLNTTSIGIEIVNGGHDFGLPPYPPIQIEATCHLARAIVDRWSVPPWNIVAHDELAPMRRRDPGELFPWPRLAEAGVGLWPEPGDEVAGSVVGALTAIGYGLDDAPEPTTVSAVLQAFQRRFLATREADGRSDLATRRRLADVARAYALAMEGRKA